MALDYTDIAQQLNDGRVTTEMLDAVLADYHGADHCEAREEALVVLLIIMARLTRSSQWQAAWDWFRENIEPPTHYLTDEQGNWDLLYKFSEDNIGMVDIREGFFSDYGRLCCTPDPNAFWSCYREWDRPIEWEHKDAQETGAYP